MKKEEKNCWDLIRCPDRLVCPAYPHSGRGCWEVTGTYCGNQRQGTYGDKIQFCRQTCDFYRAVIYGKI